MTDRLPRLAWIAGLGAAVAGPPLLWLVATPPEPLWTRLAAVTGLFALTALAAAVVLPSRLRSLNRAFGIESVMEVHRFLGVATVVLVLVHLACVVAADPKAVALLDLTRGRRPAQAAVAATVALLLLAVLGATRTHLRLRYEAWRWLHVGLAGAAFLFAVLHTWLLDHAVRVPAVHAALLVVVGGVLAVLVHRWVWRGLLDPATEFVVREVRAESPTVSTLILGPRHPAAPSWTFAPGQFAWIRLERSPAAEEHPFTIASSSHDDETSFTIRHTGDFTRSLRSLPPGTPVWLDGPHGGFTGHAGTSGFVLVAGGVGITPMMSMLRTAADRGDRRPYRLVVVASAPDDLLFREELGFLRDSLDLVVTEVLRRPHDTWNGRTGDLGVSLLALVLGSLPHPGHADWFLCGPPPMVGGVLDVVDVLDVEPSRVHTELFDFA